MTSRPLPLLLLLAACAHTPASSAAAPPAVEALALPPRTELRGPPRGEDWQGLGVEAAALLSQYIRINTTNPPGNELSAARWFATVLRRDGVESQIFEPAPGKANLYARLKGDGSARPLILLNHMDVVLASPEFWRVDPFAGAIREGYVWGRGALDMKGEGIVELLSMIALKRAGVRLRRDIIFLATADEEIGAGVGAGWMAERHPELVREAEFLLNEGGTIRADEAGHVEYVGVGTTEKSPFWLELTARGTAGHGSRPTPDNPVHRLVRALARIAAFQTPLIVTPTVERYFHDLAGIEAEPGGRGPPAQPRAGDSESPAGPPGPGDPTYNALRRKNTSITGRTATDQTHLGPPAATAAH